MKEARNINRVFIAQWFVRVSNIWLKPKSEKRSKRAILFFTIVLAGVLLIACASVLQGVPPEKRCTSDADCVPASCCHPDDTVNKQFAPDCTGILCTAVCRPETLDCGQGKVKCMAGECNAVIYED